VDMDVHEYPWIWISMDIHRKSVDMDMDMDVKFHIHGNPVIATKRKTCIANESSAVYQMGDHLATIDMGRKLGGVPHFSGGGGAGSPSNTMWPEPRPIPPCQVSSWSIQPFGHNTPTSQIDSTDGTGQTAVR